MNGAARRKGPGQHALGIALFAVLLTAASSCRADAREVAPALKVYDVLGSASAQQGSEQRPLQANALIDENNPLQVGPRSRVRLLLGARTLFELGPNARMVVHALPRATRTGPSAIRLRLERGFLRIVGSTQGDAPPVDLSLGRWAARVDAGEYFFESSSETVSACTPNGSIQWSGVPEWTPAAPSQGCVQLAPHRAPSAMAVRNQDWDAPRRNRHLLSKLIRIEEPPATIAQAAPQEESHHVKWVPAAPSAILPVDPWPSLPKPDSTLYRNEAPPTSPEALMDQDPPAAGPMSLPRVASPIRWPALKWATSLQDHLKPLTARTARSTSPTRKGRAEWVVIVDTHPTRALAERHKKELRAHGFPAAVRSERVHGQPSYRVVVEGQASEADANATLWELGARMGIRSAWILRRR